jgi:hypothetical protein
MPLAGALAGALACLLVFRWTSAEPPPAVLSFESSLKHERR